MKSETRQSGLRSSAISAAQTVFVMALAIFAVYGELFAADTPRILESPTQAPFPANAPKTNVATKVLTGNSLYTFDPLTESLPPVASNGFIAKPASHSAPSTTNLFKPDLTNGMTVLDDKYRLAIGDKLSFKIVEDEEAAIPLIVTDSGELEVPYLGRFSAVGKTCLDLAGALKVDLEKDYYYQATVIVAVDSMTKSRGRVYLVGPVRSPGPQEVPNDEVLTLSKAILRAGGFTDYADRRKVKVTRKNATEGKPEEVFTVNVEDVLEKGKIESDLPLRAGDLIYVPERLIRF